MWKYAGILIVVLGLAYVIARRDEYASLNGGEKSANQNNPAVAGKPDKKHPQEHPENTGWDSPSGHIFRAAFRWPEGTTVWAIILTLMAIAEQTRFLFRRRFHRRNPKQCAVSQEFWGSVGAPTDNEST
jgi:hypothetical protein